MYSTSPAPTYYVIDASRILGTAAITKNTAPDRIPYHGLQGATAQNPVARADAAGPNSTVGSPLYRLYDVGVYDCCQTAPIPQTGAPHRLTERGHGQSPSTDTRLCFPNAGDLFGPGASVEVIVSGESTCPVCVS
jgi:hypothetical protein